MATTEKRRLGYLLASPPLVRILLNTKAPYNISLPTASLGLSAVSDAGLTQMCRAVTILNRNRSALISALKSVQGVGRILGGNHANFLLTEIVGADGKVDNARALRVYKTLADTRGVVVRFRGNEPGCEACLRITVGTEEECDAVVERLKETLSSLA